MSSQARERSPRPFLPDDRPLGPGDRGRTTPAAECGGEVDREYVIELLNTALASELISGLRCERHQRMATGVDGRLVVAPFLEHARDERAHADRLCARIQQLGGAPDLHPSGLLSRARPGFVSGQNLPGMVRESLICERIAIETYAEMIRNVEPGDPTTTRVLSAILEDEERHAADLADLLARLAPEDPDR
ncbi:bacterioferritin [uncultured bacterium]|nr:bacterioferritin [uncultured bacterium]